MPVMKPTKWMRSVASVASIEKRRELAILERVVRGEAAPQADFLERTQRANEWRSRGYKRTPRARQRFRAHRAERSPEQPNLDSARRAARWAVPSICADRVGERSRSPDVRRGRTALVELRVVGQLFPPVGASGDRRGQRMGRVADAARLDQRRAHGRVFL